MHNQKIYDVAKFLDGYGITSYYVGGAVRDEIMGRPYNDIDVCIVGGKTPRAVSALFDAMIISSHVDTVTSVHGKFPIWIVEIDGDKYEFAMARTERKTGQSRQEFECSVEFVTIMQDLLRRDFTCNAIAINILTSEIVDPYGGQTDIGYKVLRHVSPAFREDPLRVVRAARFASILGFDIYFSTLDLCVAMSKDGSKDDIYISNERIGMELMKVFQQSDKPARFFRWLNWMGWLNPWFAELHACIGVPQSTVHHPEGDVFTHIMHCINDVPKGEWFLRATMLCHDLGKAVTTTVDDIPWNEYKVRGTEEIIPLGLLVRAKDHETAGIELTKNMLQRIHFCDHKTIRQIGCLVELHMIRGIITPKNHKKMVRRTLRRLMHYELKYSDLLCVIMHDLNGRPPKPKRNFYQVAAEMYLVYAESILEAGEMEPIVTGNMLLALEITGRKLGEIKDKALELQDRGTLNQDNWKKVLRGTGYKEITLNE